MPPHRLDSPRARQNSSSTPPSPSGNESMIKDPLPRKLPIRLGGQQTPGHATRPLEAKFRGRAIPSQRIPSPDGAAVHLCGGSP